MNVGKVVHIRTKGRDKNLLPQSHIIVAFRFAFGLYASIKEMIN